MRHLLFLATAAVLAAGILEARAADRVLIFTKNGKGFVHDNIAAATKALQEITAAAGIESEVSQDPAVFTDDNLKRFKAVIFNNTNNETVDTDDQKAAFQRYIRGGGGFVGIHSATGSERKWPWYWELIGGSFLWHAPRQNFTVQVMDPAHPSTSFFTTNTWAWKDDEFYFMKNIPEGRHILLAGVLATLKNKGNKPKDADLSGETYPLSWCRVVEGGRSWYTALGHQPAHYSNETFRRHLLGGIQWAMGTDTAKSETRNPKSE
jgi:uncharacterized protein